MPDFDKDLNPILTNTKKGIPNLDNPATPVPNSYDPLRGGGGGNLREAAVNPIFGNGPVVSKLLPTVSARELYGNRRYATYDANIVDIEDQKAYAQSNWDKAANGVLKGLNLIATTVAGGFGMLYGAAKSPFTGRLADIWDNEIMRKLDEYNNEVDQYWLPNYYTNVEKNASWYSTDNWFKTNFLFDKLIKNSGFALGAMLSGNIANAGLKSAGALIGRAAMSGATAAEASQAFKLFTPLLRNTARAFSAGKNIEAAAILEGELSSIADVTAKSSKLAELAKTTNAFSKFGETARRTAIATYSSAGEASFEALQTAKEYRNNLIEQYKNNNGGQEPTGVELEKINQMSESLGKTSFFGNLAILGITEYAQLPKLLGSSYSAEKQAANSLLGKADDVLLKEGKYVAATPTTKFGKLYSRATGVGRYFVDPKEGLQEGLQYALQVGTQNYFKKAYESKDADLWVDGFLHGFTGVNEKGEGVGAFNSKEGAESILLGAITGGLMQVKGNIQQARALKSNTESFIDGLNSAPTFKEAFKERLASANRGIVLQQQQQDAIVKGDKLEAKDLEADMMHNYLSTRIKYGRLDMTMDDIAELRQMGVTEQGLASLKEQGLANINDTINSYQQRLTNFETVAKNTAEIYKSLDLRYSGEVLKDAAGVPILDAEGRQQRKYSSAVIDKMVYAASKIADYDLRIPELSASLIFKGIDVQSIVDAELLDDSSVALASQLNELDKNGDPITTPDIKQGLKDVVEMSLRRRKFLNEYKDMVNNPNAYDETGERRETNEQGKKFRTTPSEKPEGGKNWAAQSRLPFKGDKRTYEDLVNQYGQGTQSKYEVLKKITESPYATTMEKELAAQFMKYTDRTSKIILGDRTLPNPGVSITDLSSPTASVSRINFEYNADDYEGFTIPAEFVILHEIGHDLTVYALSDTSDPFYDELKPLFDFVQDHFKKDENKYANNGLIRGGEFYAFKNIKEFATEALSNRDFQRYLNTIPYKNTQRSTWDVFTDNLKTFFKRLFGISDDTALDEVVGIVTNNIDRVYKNQYQQNKKLTEEEEKQKKEADQLKKNKEEIKKQQNEIQKDSGDVNTNDPNKDVIPGESALKSASKLFISGTTESEGSEHSGWNMDPTKSAQHIRNSREFLNNVGGFKNRKNMRAILVTPALAEAYGLKGLVQMSYGKPLDSNVNDIPNVNDNEVGFIAQVFVEQVGDRLFFVDKEGKQIGEVGEQVGNIADVIFQTMPTTKLTNSKGEPRYRSKEKEEAEAYAAAWSKQRATIFATESSAPPTIYEFVVSRGIPYFTPGETNHIAGILIDKDTEAKTLATDQTLIQIPTAGVIAHKTGQINMPNGRPILVHNDNVAFLNNIQFKGKRAQAIYEAINQIATEINEQSKAGKKIVINKKLARFLQNVLYWRLGKTTEGSNQINISEDGSSISFSGKTYSIPEIASKKDELIEAIEKAYHNVNNKSLSAEMFSKPFLEYYIDENGKLSEEPREWTNYQTYLLSSTYPDGSARSAADTPLSTNINKPTDEINYTHQQKYATLLGLELPVGVIAKKEKKAEPAPKAPTERKYDYDGKTTNIFITKLGKEGNQIDIEVEFTVKEGEAPVLVPESTINDDTLVRLTERVKQIKPEFTEDEAVAAAAGNLKALLAKELETDVVAPEAPKAEEKKEETPTAPISGETKTINIYAGTKENADLSNFANRPFREDGDISITYKEDTGKDLIFKTVEGAYQAYKIFYSDAYNDPKNENNYSKEGIKLLEKLARATGKEAKSIGQTIKGLDKKGWDNNSSEIMKDLLKASFEQNPDALAKLLATGNATLTHTQDKGKWGKEFPRLLMEVRSELASLKETTPTTVSDIEAKKADIEKRRQKELNKKNEQGYSLPMLIKDRQEALVRQNKSRDEAIAKGIKDLAPYNQGVAMVAAALNRYNKSVKEINAKYDKELKALEGAKTVDIEANKADIETKRKEQLNKIPHVRIPINAISAVRKKKKDVVTGKDWEDANQEEVNKLQKEYDEYIQQGVYTTKGMVLKHLNEAKEALSKVKEINAKYDAELAALEGKSTTETPKEPGSFDVKNVKKRGDMFRKVGTLDKTDRMSEADLKAFKEWHAAKVPNIPYEALKRMININPTEKAWGVYENGIAKFVRGGLRGTEYHEIGHGIWKMLSPEEQQAILADERSKPGKFTDRASGKMYSYDDPSVSDEMLEERIWDDFADYRLGKLPARSLGERVRRLFKMIMDFFKSFVAKPSLKEDLFKAIESGKFKDRQLSDESKSMPPQYRAAGHLTEEQTNAYVKDMTAISAAIILGNGNIGTIDKSAIYDLRKLTSDDVFKKVEEIYTEQRLKQEFGDKTWEDLVVKTKQELKALLKVDFNEEDLVNINDSETNKNDYAKEPFSTDWKKSAPIGIKFVSATLPLTESTNQENNTSFELPKLKVNPKTETYSLLGYTRVFSTMLDKLKNTTGIGKAISKLVNLANEDSNYVRMFQRLGGNLDTKTINFKDFKFEDWRLFIEMMQTYTKQKPDAVVQYISQGQVYSGSALVTGIVNTTTRGWIQNMRNLAKEQDSVIKYNSGTGTYSITDLSGIPTNTPKEKEVFLSKLGISFPVEAFNKLKEEQQKEFTLTVANLKRYLQDVKEIMNIKKKTLDVAGQYDTLATLLVSVTHPNQETTRINLDGKQSNSFADNNVASVFENEFNEVATLDELLKLRPELNDVYSKGSQLLKKGGQFFDKEGNRTSLQLKVGYIEGTKNKDDNKGTTSVKLTVGDRFTQELNQNLLGQYYILVPADGSTEWMMNMGNHVSFEDIEQGKDGWKQINKIFRGYLTDDVALALDADNRKQLRNVGAKAKELRFFKDILSEKTLSKINEMIADGSTQEDIEEYIDNNIDDINASIKDYIDGTVVETKDILTDNGQITFINRDEATGTDYYKYSKLIDTFAQKESLNKNKLTQDDLTNIITFANANYIMNNIEFHKTIFGDPYQFAIKGTVLDETKRIKSFLSPRRTTFDSPEINTFLNEEFNKAGDIDLQPGEPGYHQHKAWMNTVTVNDVNVAGSVANMKNVSKEIRDAFAKTNEGDASSIMMDGTYRELKIKNGQWNIKGKEEAWHQWQMAYTRQNMPGFKYSDDARGRALAKHDEALLKTKEPKHVIEVIKPIVSGSKNGSNTINTVLDKFSQMPIYYSMVQGTNLEKLYTKMMKENKGYIIMISGRKVGAEALHDLYTPKGEFNEEAFNNNIEVPWKAYGVQVENSYEGDKQQTRGSQLTKLSTLDLYENGEALSEDIAKEVKRNTEILDRLHKNGYERFLKRLGVIDLGGSFKIVDRRALARTLQDEMFRRELSDNVKDSIQLDKDGEFIIPFEASPAYLQIKSILYSFVDKEITSPKMNGGSYVQAPVTLWENSKSGRRIAIKTEDGYKQITRQEYDRLSPEEQKKVVLTDDTLKFYEDENGKRYCEVMLPHWFKGKLGKHANKSDKELIQFLNSTKEGREILSGIGFRIPTDGLNKVEAFKVKGFLPQYMGKTVIVPSEITTKAGSDFDIDKLNMYLKSVYIDKNGEIKIVRLKDSEEATREFYGEVFEEKLAKKRVKKLELLDTIDAMLNNEEIDQEMLDKYEDYINELFSDLTTSEQLDDVRNEVKKAFDKLTDDEVQNALKEKFMDNMYRRALENEYYDSLEKLVTLPENFKRLIFPTTDDGLKDISNILDELRGEDESLIKNRLLNRNYMTKLRHAFVTAKRWVGIAAINITGHSLAQKAKIYIDPARFNSAPLEDRKILRYGNGKVLLDHNKLEKDGKEYISLSGRLDADGKYISDGLSGYATSFVDVSKDPYILKIIKSDLVVGTFMFLRRIGVPRRQLIMFMNQPIIDEYIKLLDSKSTKTLFDERRIEEIIAKFPTKVEDRDFQGFNKAELEDNIKNYYSTKNLGDIKNKEQINIFNEFLKYAKMAEHNFRFSQAHNYDTTKFQSGDSLSLKQWRTEAAQKENIISSVGALLENTFIGEQAYFLDNSMDALGEVLPLERPEFTAITDEVLKPYSKDLFLNKDKFDRIANKIKAAFLDYIIQKRSDVATNLQEQLADDKKSVAQMLVKAQQEFPGVQIIQDLEVDSSGRIGGAQTIKLRVNDKIAYNENMYTGMMRELRDDPRTNALYKGIVRLAILQGTYQSPISIKNIIPVEDYAAEITPIVSGLRVDDELIAFAKSNEFQRNEWQDNDVVPVVEPKFQEVEDLTADPDAPRRFQFALVKGKKFIYKGAFPTLPGLVKSKERQLLFLNTKYNAKVTKYDVVKVPRAISINKKKAEEGKIDVATGIEITNQTYAEKIKKGDTSLQNYYGYQKVKYADGSPLIVDYDNDANPVYVYKFINLHGDGMYATEYYGDGRPSVFSNGSQKNVKNIEGTIVSNEIPDQVIVDYYGGENVPTSEADVITSTIENETSVAPTQVAVSGVQNPQYKGLTEFNKLPGKSATPTMTYAGIGSRQTPPEVLAQMTEVAKELETAGYTLNTGKKSDTKEEGADKAFSDGAKKKNLFSPSIANERTRKIANEIHPNLQGMYDAVYNKWVKTVGDKKAKEYAQGAIDLQARNTNQVFGENLDKPVDFVLFYAEETENPLRPKGGTGQAVEMARRKGIPTINMANSNWRQELDRVLSAPTQAVSEKVEPSKYDLKGKSILELREMLEKSIEGIERPSADGGFRSVSYYSEILKNNKFKGFFGPSKIDAIVEIRKGKYDGDLLTAQSQQPTAEVKKKELFTPEKGVVQKSFRGKSIDFVDKIDSKKETVVAMSNREGKILIDQKAMEQKFKDKSWTKPAKQLDGSFATPLAENEFGSFNEWFTFALIHETKHDTIKQTEGETIGQYEDRINQAALEDLRKNYNIPTKTVSPEVRFKDKEGRIRIDYPTEIYVEETKDTFKTNKLLEIQKVFTEEDDGTIADQRKFDEEYEEWLGGYGMTDSEYQYALKNQEVLRDLLNIADRELTDSEGNVLTFDTFGDVIDELLRRNERLVDTAQMSLFDPNNENLDGADEPNPCGQ